jgi:hypothetical protein
MPLAAPVMNTALRLVAMALIGASLPGLSAIRRRGGRGGQGWGADAQKEARPPGDRAYSEMLWIKPRKRMNAAKEKAAARRPLE